jgi:hypothetical protein
MAETELVCAILRVLVSDHAYGKPRPRDILLNKAAYPPHKGGAAKEAYETVRKQEFGALVQFLYDECRWERFELELRIKYFEGWDEIEWDE